MSMFGQQPALMSDRGIILSAGVANAQISGSGIRDMMLEADEERFGATRALHACRTAEGCWHTFFVQSECCFNLPLMPWRDAL